MLITKAYWGFFLPIVYFGVDLLGSVGGFCLDQVVKDRKLLSE